MSSNNSELPRLLQALKQARSHIEVIEHRKTEPIAIIGVGCRFPGSVNNPETFWQLLENGVDAITEIPPERWQIDRYYHPDPNIPGKMYTRNGGFLDQVDAFDPQFFGISPREAESMDPQQRLLLEVCWEAIENAGIAPDKLFGSSTGIFVGMGADDYSRFSINSGDRSQINPYTSLGNARSIAVGRLAYVLGVNGPTMQLDTSCSSSLLAVHLACQNLRSGESNLALVGGVNLMLSPEMTIGFCKLQALAVDGRCKTFDANANGYGRGEGCGIIVLKRLSDALADRDRILAVVKGSAVNHDGRSNGLTAPNGSAQEAVIRQALANAKVKPEQIQYVEVHGTGTPLGDPIEVSALSKVFTPGRNYPLYIGSVKTNFGHLEAAAGIASMIKTVLALQQQKIPPSLHFNQPNPYIPWEKIPIVVPKQPIPWSHPESLETSKNTRLAGVSSFGMSGTNVHVILAASPELSVASGESDRPCHLLTLSAKSEQALQEIARDYVSLLSTNTSARIADICFTANVGRSHFDYRLAVVAESTMHLYEQLKSFAIDKQTDVCLTGQKTSWQRPKIAFLFTGQGSQYVGMGRELYQTQPVFRHTIIRCDEILRPYLEKSLLDVLYNDCSANALMDETAYTQPVIFALEYALFELWKHWGIAPDVVMGHSVGEYVAACVAGVFSLESGLKLIAERGRLMQELPPGGKMVAVMASEATVRPLIAGKSSQVSIAAFNGSNNLVISGESEVVDVSCIILTANGVKTTPLQVSHAFHSPLMEPMLSDFLDVARQLTYNSPQIPLISNVTGVQAGDEIATPEYWVNHVTQPVRFADSIMTLKEIGYQIFLEVGPKPVLLGMARQSLPDESIVQIPSIRPGIGDWQQMLQSLGQLYVQGVEVDWSSFDRDYVRSKVVLPNYPFQRQRYWMQHVAEQSPRTVNSSSHSHSRSENVHPLMGRRLCLPFSPEIRFETCLAVNSPPHQEHHRLFGINIVAAASHTSLVLSAVKEGFGAKSCTLEEVFFQKALVLSEDKSSVVQVVFNIEHPNKSNFQIISLEAEAEAENQDNSWVKNVIGSASAGIVDSTVALTPEEIQTIQQRSHRIITGDEFYNQFHQAGYTLGSAFCWIGQIWLGVGEALGRMDIPELPDNVSDYQLYPGLLDSCFQVLGSCWTFNQAAGETLAQDYIFIPFHIRNLQFFQPPKGNQLWCYARRTDSNDNHEVNLRGDILIFDQDGDVIAKITDFGVRKTSRTALSQSLKPNLSDLFYEQKWLISPPINPPNLVSQAGYWLIFAPISRWTEQLAETLRLAGDECILVYPGQNYQKLDQRTYQLCPNQPEDFSQLLSELSSEETVKGIIHLWSLNTPIDLSPSNQELNSASALYLLQAQLSKSSDRNSEKPPIWLVTQGVHQIGDDPKPLQIQQAPLWGLGRAIAVEHPEINSRCLDLELGADSAQLVKVMLAELRSPDAENQIAYRDGIRHVCRLHRARLNKINQVDIGKQASYLITGGLGALGLEIAQWLTAQGAGHIGLIGRREPSPTTQQIIRDLETTGTKISVLLGDIAQEQDVARVLHQMAASSMPLRGIIHAAGVLDDRLIEQMTWKSFQEVMQPKVAGGWYLHKFTTNLSLDFFVCFSSISSLLGSSGQVNYAAANAFLDALVHYRQALGLPGLSINWGPWNKGMVSDLRNQHLQRLQTQGISLISASQGLSAFSELLSSTMVQVGVFPINWQQFGEKLPRGVKLPFLQQFISPEQLESQSSKLIQYLEETPIDMRREYLLSHVRSRIAKILGIAKPEQIGLRERLFDLGIDSLMALELKNLLESDLGATVRSTVLFDYPTLEALTEYLSNDVLCGKVSFLSDNQISDKIEPEADLSDNLQEMSQDEIARLLFEKLNALEGSNLHQK